MKRTMRYVTLQSVVFGLRCTCGDCPDEGEFEYQVRVPKKFMSNIIVPNDTGKAEPGECIPIANARRIFKSAILEAMSKLTHCGELSEKGAWCHNDGTSPYDSDKIIKKVVTEPLHNDYKPDPNAPKIKSNKTNNT